ncbi:hypothetical protein GGI12_004624 [Dipsacomyces acuminosporus]|nr:hypothetical protein GGI12_004624 [Dipsacomyces acuminosporus]
MLLKKSILLLAATAVVAASASTEPAPAKRDMASCMAIGCPESPSKFDLIDSPRSAADKSPVSSHQRQPFTRPRRGDVSSDSNTKKPSTGGKGSKNLSKRGRSASQVVVDVIGNLSGSRRMLGGPFKMHI